MAHGVALRIRGQLTLYTAPMKRMQLVALILCLYSGAAWAQALIVSQVVDGDVWQTTMVLTNTTAASAVASLRFFQETTGNATVPWNLTFLEMSSVQAISLAPVLGHSYNP